MVRCVEVLRSAKEKNIQVQRVDSLMVRRFF